MCFDLWKFQGLTQCWFDRWEQGLGAGSCCCPVSVEPPLWLHWGMLTPQTSPEPGTSRTNTGPRDVVSGVLTKTQEFIVLLTPPHGHNCAGRARRATPAAAWEEPQPEQQSLSTVLSHSQRRALGLWHPWIFP